MSRRHITNFALSVSNATIANLNLTNTVIVYSDAIDCSRNVGFFTLLVSENKAGGAGDVDIYAEYSDDGTTFYRPYTSDMAGAITVEGNIVSTLQNSTRWIAFTARLARYMRIAFDPDADSRIGMAKLIFQDDI